MAELLEWQHDREYVSLEYRYGTGLWTTKEGVTLKISEMADSHIENAIKYIHKHEYFLNVILDDIYLRESKLEELNKELERRKHV